MSKQSQPGRADVYSRITDRILTDLAQGVRPWLKPWTGPKRTGTLPRRHNGVRYRGINILLLWGDAIEKGFTSNIWMTYRQAAEIGAQVRKGEHGSLVVYADRVIKTETTAEGEEDTREIAFMKGYTVFNLEQIDNLPPTYADPLPGRAEPLALAEAAEAFFSATGARIEHGGYGAFYRRNTDTIHLPRPDAFRDAEGYAATKAHELVHWTGHDGRLAREFGKRFGDNAYAFEELVAELGAAFLCADLGIAATPRDDHASYLANWLKVLKDDKRAIVSAAAHAQRAIDYLHSLQPQP